MPIVLHPFRVLVFAIVALWIGVRPLSAQSRAERLAHFRAVTDSALTAEGSRSGPGAVVGGVAGGVAFAAMFYHFSYRSGEANTAEANLGASLVGASFGAIAGALAGAFVGSLFPKHPVATAP
jgi:hypothetical protein